jgi:polyisoprenoid-binding protein YceI
MHFRCLQLGLLASSLVVFASGAERTLAVDPAHSKIEVVVKATLDSFVGQLTRYDAQIGLDENEHVKTARISFRFRDVETGKRGRDDEMHAWQQTDVHPDGVFILTSLESSEGVFTAIGRLTFHGMTRELRFPVSINREAGRYAIAGEAVVDTREFGLPVFRKFGVLKVDPHVRVRFHLQGVAAPVVAGS